MSRESDTLQKALFSIKKLKQLLDEKSEKTAEPIAIVGLSCRFPQANDKNEFWELLSQGKNAISKFPEDRWELLAGSTEANLREKNHSYWGSFLPNLPDFDAYFFGISPREAARMDPQQRFFLEVAYEAFEDAGIPLEKLAGSKTGVFASLYASQFGYLQKIESDMDALYIPTGSAISIAANRLSYLFDLRGPSIVLDTACSSSLVALHLACLNLQNKLCDIALVGAANINLIPSINAILSQAKMLSPDGQCKTFDASANGYVQGEGIGALVLKPLSKALQDKDRVYAVIMGSNVNQDGKTNGMTAPSGLQQEALIKSLYATLQLDPGHLSYVECHGTGTFLGDPIELQALGEAVGSQHDSVHPCWVGSVKTNIGHLEPAAGVASLIKVTLALQHKQIPPHLNFVTPNPHIAFEKYHLQVPKTLQAWPQYGEYRLAGISGFGFGGTNAHVALREALAQEKSISEGKPRQDEIFTLSAKDPQALQALVKQWCTYLENNMTEDLSALCYNTHLRRAHHGERLAIIANTVKELLITLQKLKDNLQAAGQNIYLTTEKSKAQLKGPDNFLSVTSAELAKLYVNNADIRWEKYEEGRHYPLIDMPLYPWQHKHYWPSLASTPLEVATQDNYPLRGKTISSPLETLQFEFQFDTKTLPEIVDTFNILHAGYYLEMLAFVADQHFQKEVFTIEEINFKTPIVVVNNALVKVQLILEAQEDNKYAFSFYSNANNQQQWLAHAKGMLVLDTFPCKVDSLSVIQKRCTEKRTAETFFSRVLEMGMPAGETIRWAQTYWLGDKEILCQFKEPEACKKNTNFKLKTHLGIVDGAVQPIFILLPHDIMKPYVAFQIKNLKYYGNPNDELYYVGKLIGVEEKGKIAIGRWTLFTKSGQVIADCEEMRTMQLDNKIKIQQASEIAQDTFNFSASSTDERVGQVTNYLCEQIAEIFSMPKSDINVAQSLSDMGMDSIMALALVRIIDTSFHVNYPMQNVLQGASITTLVEFILEHTTPSISAPSAQAQTPSLWIAYRQKQNNAKMRLFCFPYGGGGASIYRDWQKELPDFIEVCPVQLPGREERMNENPISDFKVLMKKLIENLTPQLDLPFAIFGHSFGSLLGFELARHLKARNLSKPTHVFASAFPDPSMPSKSLDNIINQIAKLNINLFDLENSLAIENLQEDQLKQIFRIFSENGVVEYNKLTNLAVIKVLLPIFIGDMRLVKNYHYQPDPVLDIPITVFLGLKDDWVLPEDTLGWKNQTSKKCDFYELDAGHLFIREELFRKKVLAKIAEGLAIYQEKNFSL